jgi:hypothetical protein
MGVSGPADRAGLENRPGPVKAETQKGLKPARDFQKQGFFKKMIPRRRALFVFCLTAAFSAMLSAAPAFAQEDLSNTCPAADAPPVLASKFENDPPKYTNALTSAELGHFKVSTVVARAPREIFRVGGLTSSLYSPTYNIEFLIRSNPGNGHACLYIKKVDLELVLAPTVYIAHEFPPGSCRYNDTLHHEQRHVATSVITLNEYMPALTETARRAMEDNAVVGPFISGDADAVQQNVAANIRAALQKELDVIDKVHFQRQQAIDTRAEYLRATRACPNEPLP